MPYETVSIAQIPKDMMGVDIGEKTQKKFADAMKGAKTVVWNGPMGVFEMKEYAKGTLAIAQAMANSEAVTIIGGGIPQQLLNNWVLQKDDIFQQRRSFFRVYGRQGAARISALNDK